jgi:hypothetical protein
LTVKAFGVRVVVPRKGRRNDGALLRAVLADARAPAGVAVDPNASTSIAPPG